VTSVFIITTPCTVGLCLRPTGNNWMEDRFAAVVASWTELR
jgi:hypothetical protein